MKKNVLIILGVIIFAVLVERILANAAFFEHLELMSYDLRSRIDTDARFFGKNSGYADKDIVIVAIDNESEKVLLANPKAWEANVWKNVMMFIEKDKPKAVMFDMVFERLTDEPWYNKTFAESLVPYDNTVLGTYLDKPLLKETNFSKKINLVDNDYIPTMTPLDVTIDDKKLDDTITYTENSPIDRLYERYNTIGVLNSVLDSDSVVRKNQPIFKLVKGGKSYYMPSLAFAGFLKYMGEGDKIVIKKQKIYYKNRVIPIDENGVVNISRHRLGHNYSYIPISKILLNKGGKNGIKPGFFKNKLVIIGQTATGGNVNLSSIINSTYTGPEANAIALDNFINDSIPSNKKSRRFIYEIPKPVQFLLTAAACIIVAGLGLVSKSAFIGCINGALSIFIYIIFCFWLFVNPTSRVWVPIVVPLYYLSLTSGIVFAYRFYKEMTRKNSIMNTFGKFVSPAVLKTVMKNPENMVLKNTKKRITILFCDVKDFSSLSEKYDPEKLVNNLNELFKEIVNIIFENNGTVDKFIGDCIMAYWGDLVDSEDSEFMAVKTALEIKQKIQELKIKNAHEGKIIFDVKIGINTGEAILGLTGTDRIMSYTAMGDAVNVASRLENSCTKYKRDILISKSTYDAIKDKVTALDVGQIAVKGKNELIETYEPIALVGDNDYQEEKEFVADKK
ncbi:MAG: adenylate/guanylate cyclase domain-containing protein [Candidatus Gastranaerophilaceae bacterium]